MDKRFKKLRYQYLIFTATTLNAQPIPQEKSSLEKIYFKHKQVARFNRYAITSSAFAAPTMAYSIIKIITPRAWQARIPLLNVPSHRYATLITLGMYTAYRTWQKFNT